MGLIINSSSPANMDPSSLQGKVMAKLLYALEPHALFERTLTLPVDVLKFTKTLVKDVTRAVLLEVTPPATILAPEGTVQR